MISGHEQCCQIGIPWAVAQQKKMPEEPQEDATPRTMREKPRNEERRDSESLGYIDREHGNQQPQPISEDEKKKRHFASFGDTDTQKQNNTHIRFQHGWMELKEQ